MVSTTTGRVGTVARATHNVVLRVALYYAALLLLLLAAWRYVPHSQLIARESMDALFGSVAGASRRAATPPLDQTTLALTVALAMVSSVLLVLPVAWIYVLTRAKRGYQQSVVQTLLVLPVVVAGIVVLVKYSIALAFSLAGIVAAVRFRNTLDDSKDAVYVFLATAIGLAAAVDLPVALVISVLFNTLILVLWYTDFGRAPAHLEGRMAERRLQRALEQMSRTGTFVARVDEQLFQDMSAEQLAAVADRAWRRARRHNPEAPDPDGRREALLRVRTYDVAGSRAKIEPLLEASLKRWRYGGVVHEQDGTHVVEYAVQLKKSLLPDVLLETLRSEAAPDVIGAELS
ncbi:MAG TPA: DUF4956 domain-containing protein [Gemmatimonadaceae bacterium]|nr:DUF4956 domain-containing protein [Gemmatimonadaceae bacterium]